MRRINLLAIAILIFSSIGATAGTTLVNLRTQSLETPVGLEESHPVFSWQLSSEAYGAAQKSYRVIVASSLENLAKEDFVYDSGEIRSDASTFIPYKGKALRGSTRYFWKVRITDQDNNTVESDPSWFETGLMSNGWSGAKWIGSQKIGVSKYRTFFIVDYDVRVEKGSDTAVFAYSVKDEKNFITVTLDVKKEIVDVNYSVEGDLRHLSTINVSDIINEANRFDVHKMHLKVTTPGYHLKSNLVVTLDGKKLLPGEGVSAGPARENVSTGDPYEMVMYPYPNGEYITDWARLHSIGFKQPKGQKAEFSNIVISEDSWNTVLYTDPVGTHNVTGNGKLQVWEPYGLVSAPMLRKSVTFNKPVKSARLYATARGVYEFYINGERVSNDYFNPGWTDYRYRIMYNSYDITGLLKSGENAFGAMLGSGWYSDLNIFSSADVDEYGIKQSLLAKVIVTFEDGTSQIIVTDGSWKKYDNGPVTRNGFQFGEDYDARKEVDGWKCSGFDDTGWDNADIFDKPSPVTELQAYVGLPVRNNVTLTAISVKEPVKGTFVYDFGQNIVGVPRLEGMKGRSGQVVNLRYGEMIYPETIPVTPVAPYTIEMYNEKKGQVYVENYRGAISIDNYTMKGRKEGETYQPIFTDHGFRYVSITGLDKALPLSSVKAVVLESIGDATCHYECSDSNINRLFENILWGQRGNFQAVPTDCPQRDERQGWTGDAQVFARAATYYSPWVDQFYTRWLYSVRDNQNLDGSYLNYFPFSGRPPYGYDPKEGRAGVMGWMEAGIIIPWQMYQQYGDTDIIRQHYDSMVKYMDYLERTSTDYIPVQSGLGDHLSIERTNIGLTNTAYYAYDAYMMARMAAAIGKTEDSAKYSLLYENIKKAFNKTYIDKDGYTVAPYNRSAYMFGGAPAGAKEGDIIKVDTQTSYALPLYFGIVDDSIKDKFVKNFVENIKDRGYKLTTGFIGTPYLNPALSLNGYDDIAYALFEQTECPSWLYPILQGATTMWERWNSYTIENGFGPVDMNSFNHYAYGAIGEWMYSYNLGIQRDEEKPGYKHIILQPKVGGKISYANGDFETPYGIVASGWEKTATGYVYRVTVPANTTASLTLQAESIADVKVVKGKEGIGPFRSLKGKVMAELVAGSYEFSVYSR